MSDLQTLTDAFAELERRADAASGRTSFAPAARQHAHTRPLLVAASVVATLAVAGGVTLLTRGGDAGSTAAAPPNTKAVSSHHATAKPGFRVPKTPAELASRFRAVLGDTATFIVTDTGTPVEITLAPAIRGGHRPETLVPNTAGKPIGAAIVGTLTASGITGGFDIQILRDKPGAKASCDDPDRSRCTVRRLRDGSSLAVGRESLPTVNGGITYLVDLVRGDGVEFLMHVSNARDPKGESALLAARPPLTRKQMVGIVTSNRW